MKQISNELLLQLRKTYLPDTRIALVRMNDPYSKLKPGDRGSVVAVDDIGTIFVNWDCGSSLGVAYGEDSCRIIVSE